MSLDYSSSIKKVDKFNYCHSQLMAILKRKLGVLLLISCFTFASIHSALCMSPAPTIYVSGDGTGDFNCNGTDDHLQINKALAYIAANPGYTTVHLKGPFTYVINGTLLIGSNTILEGDSNAVIKLADHACWDTMKPLIQQMNSSGNNNIVIRGFEVNVNHDNNTEFARGKGYYNVIYFLRCNNVKVYNMYMHDGHGDGLRIRNSQNIQFYNNRISKLGHDGLFAIECNNVEAWSNIITCRTNSGLRAWNSNYVKFHANEIDASYYKCTGGPGIQIEKSAGIMDNIEIYNNTFNNTYGPGIWIFNYDNSSTRDQGKDIYIHHNVFHGTGTNPSINWIGGILAGGFNNTIIENNVFDGAYNAAVVHMYMPGYSSSYSPAGGYITIVRSNVIVNTVRCRADPSGGYGVINNLPETHSFVFQNNCLYNNIAGNYKNCNSTSDIYMDPLFADQKKHDYHLKSAADRWDGNTWVQDSVSSPCIDAGYPSSDYSKEPEENGDRINIGRYGNTIYASKSYILKNKNAPVITSIPNATIGVGENLNFTVTASDADGDNLTYSASNLPTGTTLNNESGFFSWTPATGQEGIYEITFNVSDGTFNDSETANISVILKNKYAPVITSIPNTTIEIGENLNFTVTAFDADGDNLTYSASGLPVGANFNENSGFFSWTPATGQEGTYKITFNVSDGTFNDSETANISVILKNKYTPVIITISNTTIEIGENLNFTVTASDADGDNLTYSASNLPTGAALDNKSGFFSWTPATGQEGTYKITFNVSDGTFNDSETANISVIKKGSGIDNNSSMNLPGKVYDNRLRESSPNSILGNDAYIDVGGMSTGRYRDITWFNISQYTDATKVSNATLSLFWYYPSSSRPNDTIIEIYRPASSWNPSYVSWNKRDNGITWNNAGGDWYDKNGVLQGNTPYATLTIKASTLPNITPCELNVTDLVKEYASGKYANTGFLIKARSESNNYIAFYSSDCGNASRVPKLNITYK